MRFFVCLVNPSGAPVSDEARREYELLARSRRLTFRWYTVGALSALLASDDDALDGDAHVVHREGYTAVGVVRLDNRPDLQRWAGPHSHDVSDLELTQRVLERHGAEYVERILGDFAFILWNPSARTVIAACDAFAVKKLFYAERGGLLAFANRGEALALKEEFDLQYLAERVAACVPSPGHSVYAGVQLVPAGSTALFERGKVTTQRYWAAHQFEPEAFVPGSEREAAETCRQLLVDGIHVRLTDKGDTWAQLSGGMDSSSVVSVAQWLAESRTVSGGLAGTVTWVDSHGTGADEREYSDAVVNRFGVRNEMIVDSVLWQDDDLGPPRVDEPSGLYPFYVRDRRLCAIVRGAGGRVLLTGQGGDDLFAGNMFFFADWLTAGRVGTALREMARRAAIGRASFWELAYKNALLPIFPAPIQRCLVRQEGRVPPWILPAVSRRYELRSRASAPQSYAGRIGRKYGDAVAALVAGIPAKFTNGIVEDTLDVRHPYLYRPLVEFALRLPPELCVRPYARKWILREATRNVLPDFVRTRIGKGVLYGLLTWSMATYGKYLEPLTADPILAQLGIIDAKKLRAAFAASRYERDKSYKLSPDVQYTLAVEAWLQVRSGRWQRGRHGREYGNIPIRSTPQEVLARR